jgi:hypothetical protein
MGQIIPFPARTPAPEEPFDILVAGLTNSIAAIRKQHDEEPHPINARTIEILGRCLEERRSQLAEGAPRLTSR